MSMSESGKSGDKNGIILPSNFQAKRRNRSYLRIHTYIHTCMYICAVRLPLAHPLIGVTKCRSKKPHIIRLVGYGVP